ncbi:MAG: hypothetical protein V4555_17380 [Acidobacteriota bacterium]
MDGLQGYIRQAMVMEAGSTTKQESVTPTRSGQGQFTRLLEQLKMDRRIFMSDLNVTFRQDENRWWNL